MNFPGLLSMDSSGLVLPQLLRQQQVRFCTTLQCISLTFLLVSGPV
jgi:hypothetical protein